MGLYGTVQDFKLPYIFTFISASNLEFCTRSYSSCFSHDEFKGLNGNVCKMMVSHFDTLHGHGHMHFWLYYSICPKDVTSYES